MGVVKGFQIACNLPGPLGDLTGKGEQPSGKVIARREPDKNWTRQEDIQHRRDRTKKAHRGVLFGQSTDHWETGLDQVTSQVGKWCWREVLDEPRRQPARNQNNQKRTLRSVLVDKSGIVRIHITK